MTDDEINVLDSLKISNNSNVEDPTSLLEFRIVVGSLGNIQYRSLSTTVTTHPPLTSTCELPPLLSCSRPSEVIYQENQTSVSNLVSDSDRHGNCSTRWNQIDSEGLEVTGVSMLPRRLRTDGTDDGTFEQDSESSVRE